METCRDRSRSGDTAAVQLMVGDQNRMAVARVGCHLIVVGTGEPRVKDGPAFTTTPTEKPTDALR